MSGFSRRPAGPALTGIDTFEFVESRVVQHWHETDHLEMFQQLGAELQPVVDA